MIVLVNVSRCGASLPLLILALVIVVHRWIKVGCVDRAGHVGIERFQISTIANTEQSTGGDSTGSDRRWFSIDKQLFKNQIFFWRSPPDLARRGFNQTEHGSGNETEHGSGNESRQFYQVVSHHTSPSPGASTRGLHQSGEVRRGHRENLTM